MNQQKKRLQATSFLCLFWIPLVAFLVACGRTIGSHESLTVQIPWIQNDNTYALAPVTLTTVNDISTFSGEAARIKVDPIVNRDDASAPEPHFKYMLTSQGAVVPTDFISLQMATAYAHDEYLWQLDKDVGAGDWLSHPRSIGMIFSLMGGSERLTNNALYYSGLDILLIVPYERGGLPLSMNAGVLAHEHFHALFQTSVLRDLPLSVRAKTRTTNESSAFLSFIEKADQKTSHILDEPTSDTLSNSDIDRFNQTISRALNEGLADFWGWVYTGDDNFIAASLPEVRDSRRLDRRADKIASSDSIKLVLKPGESSRGSSETEDERERRRISYSYTLGTQYSRWMRSWATVFAKKNTSGEKPNTKLPQYITPMTKSDRIVAGRKLIQSLSGLRTRMEQAIQKNETISPNVLILSLMDHGITPVTEESCGLARNGLSFENDAVSKAFNKICGATGVEGPK